MGHIFEFSNGSHGQEPYVIKSSKKKVELMVN